MALQCEGGDSHSLPLGTSWGQAQGCCPVGVGPARPAHLSSRGRRLWGDPDKDPVTDCVLKPSVRCPKGTGRGEASVPAEPGGGPSYGRLRTLAARRPCWGQSYGTRTQSCHPSLHVLWNPTRIPRGEGPHQGRGWESGGLEWTMWVTALPLALSSPLTLPQGGQRAGARSLTAPFSQMPGSLGTGQPLSGPLLPAGWASPRGLFLFWGVSRKGLTSR